MSSTFKGPGIDWHSLLLSDVTQAEILEAVKDPAWQKLRESLKGKTLEQKYWTLKKWLLDHNNSRRARVQVSNYVQALKRGGLIKGI